MSENNLEVWKDIPGFEEKYQVSTMGRVRSLTRMVMVTNFNGTTFTVKKRRNYTCSTKRCNADMFTLDY